MDDKLRKLLADLDAAIERTKADGRIDDDEVRELRDLLQRMEDVVEAPEEEHEGIVDHLEEATVRFESNHPTIAAVIRSAVDTLTGYGM